MCSVEFPGQAQPRGGVNGFARWSLLWAAARAWRRAPDGTRGGSRRLSRCGGWSKVPRQPLPRHASPVRADAEVSGLKPGSRATNSNSSSAASLQDGTPDSRYRWTPTAVCAWQERGDSASAGVRSCRNRDSATEPPHPESDPLPWQDAASKVGARLAALPLQVRSKREKVRRLAKDGQQPRRRQGGSDTGGGKTCRSRGRPAPTAHASPAPVNGSAWFHGLRLVMAHPDGGPRATEPGGSPFREGEGPPGSLKAGMKTSQGGRRRYSHSAVISPTWRHKSPRTSASSPDHRLEQVPVGGGGARIGWHVLAHHPATVAPAAGRPAPAGWPRPPGLAGRGADRQAGPLRLNDSFGPNSTVRRPRWRRRHAQLRQARIPWSPRSEASTNAAASRMYGNGLATYPKKRRRRPARAPRQAPPRTARSSPSPSTSSRAGTWSRTWRSARQVRIGLLLRQAADRNSRPGARARARGARPARPPGRRSPGRRGCRWCAPAVVTSPAPASAHRADHQERHRRRQAEAGEAARQPQAARVARVARKASGVTCSVATTGRVGPDIMRGRRQQHEVGVRHEPDRGSRPRGTQVGMAAPSPSSLDGLSK